MKIPVWSSKDHVKILRKFPKNLIVFERWSNHDQEVILLTGLNINVKDLLGT